MSMYNNDITYHEKWNTKENIAALAKLDAKFFNKSECRADCPVAWAPEVLELMETLERELGFKYNEKTIRGYYIQGTPLDWFLKRPWSELFYAFKKNVFEKPTDHDAPRGADGLRPRKTIWKRIKSIPMAFFKPILYGFRALTVMYVNPIRNRYLNKRISLGQLKEKYGYLTCYFHAPEAFREFIDQEKAKCSIKLALKGAYYPIESLYNNATQFHCDNEHHPDTYEVTRGKMSNGEPFTNVKITTMRKYMQDMGLNLKEIKDKADMRAASKADPL